MIVETSDARGIEVDAPVLYRGMQVGIVKRLNLSELGDRVMIHVSIESNTNIWCVIILNSGRLPAIPWMSAYKGEYEFGNNVAVIKRRYRVLNSIWQSGSAASETESPFLITT
ncbi:mce related protein [Actinobacillus equuli]|nr:mce related protein [Actinobacillus equuli]